MTLQVFIGILIRHLLTTIGGGAIVQGLLTGDTINQVAGTVAGIVGIVLSGLEKRNR